MQAQWRHRIGLVTLVVLIFLAAPSLAARKGGAVDDGSDVNIARANLAPHLVSFEPLVDFESMTLTVKGDQGVVFEGEYGAGSALTFDLFDQEGARLPDGLYTYELKANPRIAPEIRQALEYARQNGDDAQAERRLRDAGILPKLGRSMSLTGAFTIADGAVVDPNLPESGSAKLADPGFLAGNAVPQDFVINDDLIVTGSACVGFDCTNGLAFGFDTIIVKENNLRIFFDDTSNSASFPTTNWRLTANDTANGGASRFSIDNADTNRSILNIMAAAPSNSLFVDGSGRLGIRNASPVVDIHVLSGNTPTLRLAQDASSGFTPQTWDLAGNETNLFIRDATNGSTLPFRIRPGAPTSSVDIAADGDIGMGTSSPGTLSDGSEASVHIRRTDGDASLLIEEASTTAMGRDLFEVRNLGGVGFRFLDNSNGVGYRFLNSGSSFQIVKATPAPSLTVFSVTSGGNGTFAGNLNVTGTLTKGGGAFKIDHPLDPANKYLSHSFVESPDMMNIYNGIAKLDAEGEAWVTLPDWFEALNQDFRYQLTAIGAAAPSLHVAQEVAGNRFKIAGGPAGTKVSWQLTGIRHDPYAEAYRIKTEEDKPLSQRGYYLHPTLYGQSEAKNVANAPSDVQPAVLQKAETASTKVGNTARREDR